MNEYYKKRYNISNYFLNVDTDDYYNNNSMVILFIAITLIIYTIYPIIFIITNKNINTTVLIYIIFLIFYYIISYKLYISLKNISSNELLLNYYQYYNLANIIFKENLNNASFNNSNINDGIIKNINNIENVYGNKATELKNTTKDILKYYTYDNTTTSNKYDTENENSNIENIYTQRLYINFKNFSYLHKNLKFINYDNSTIDLKQDEASSLNNPYVDVKIMEEYYKNSNERNQLLNYINKKYNTNFNSLYRPSIFTSKFNKKLDIIINEIKNNIYNFIYISIFFIAISLQNLLIQFNIFMVHIYISIILILFIFMYYYTNTL
jgi:hypothetical protein